MTSGHRNGIPYTPRHHFRPFWRRYNTSTQLASSVFAQFTGLGQPLWASSHSSKFSLDRTLIYFYDCKHVLWMNNFTELLTGKPILSFKNSDQCRTYQEFKTLLSPYMAVFHLILLVAYFCYIIMKFFTVSFTSELLQHLCGLLCVLPP